MGRGPLFTLQLLCLFTFHCFGNWHAAWFASFNFQSIAGPNFNIVIVVYNKYFLMTQSLAEYVAIDRGMLGPMLESF